MDVGVHVPTSGEIDLRSLAFGDPSILHKRSVAGRTAGVAVAALELAWDGSIRSVRVLESPDSEIARRCAHGLKQWRSSVPTTESDMAGLAVRGKLTYDFVLEA